MAKKHQNGHISKHGQNWPNLLKMAQHGQNCTTWSKLLKLIQNGQNSPKLLNPAKLASKQASKQASKPANWLGLAL
jgi:hypothetical protein